MGKTHKPLSELIHDLPLDDQAMVQRLVEYLLSKRKQNDAGPIDQSWAGLLHEYRSQYTSFELQQKAVEWRNQE